MRMLPLALALSLVFVAGVAGCTSQPGQPVLAPEFLPPAPETHITPSVSVSDQGVGGETVTVSRVVAAEPGWIVIHADAGGSPGAGIGETIVAQGENEDVVVEIERDRATPALYAMLHVDRGEQGSYEFPGPDVPATEGGQVVAASFQVTGLPEDAGGAGPAGGDERTITITAAGFSPQSLAVLKGATVTWVNKDTAQHWPASAVHPTHEAYPGSSITKCNTPGEANTFDACRGIPAGGSWSFTFSEAGSWDYHDHLAPGTSGKIIVE